MLLIRWCFTNATNVYHQFCHLPWVPFPFRRFSRISISPLASPISNNSQPRSVSPTKQRLFCSLAFHVIQCDFCASGLWRWKIRSNSLGKLPPGLFVEFSNVRVRPEKVKNQCSPLPKFDSNLPKKVPRGCRHPCTDVDQRYVWIAFFLSYQDSSVMCLTFVRADTILVR